MRKGVPALLDDIVIRALTREVDGRYQTAAEMADDLSAFCRKLGDTPLINLSLPAGRYTLTLVNDSRNIHSAIEVVVEPGKTTVKKLRL